MIRMCCNKKAAVKEQKLVSPLENGCIHYESRGMSRDGPRC